MSFHQDTLWKLEKAARIYDSMNDGQKEVVGLYVDQIVGIQRDVNRVAGKVCADLVCKKCGGGCCTEGIEYGLEVGEFLYAMFKITKGYRDKIRAVIEGEHEKTQCYLIDSSGCVLPPTVRPVHCKAFHCSIIPEGDEIMEEYGKKLHQAYANYVMILDDMDIVL